jgi:2,5-diketo-D-gluconate reductase B
MVNEFLIKNSIKVPVIGFGTYKLTGKEGQQAMEQALSTGYRHIDTAEYYQNEKEVGQAVKNSGISREDIFITTKIWPDNFNKLPDIATHNLKRLNMDYVDLLLLHWPSTERENMKALDKLSEALSKGYTRSIGISNFSIPQMIKAKSKSDIICNQLEFNPFSVKNKELEFAKENGMFITAYSPLARGRVANNKTLKTIGEKYGKTASQAALRWLLELEDIVIIPKATDPSRIKENFELFDFRLDAEDHALIRSLANTI